MLAATYAKQIGRGVAFSLAAFRQAFAGGRDLGDRDTRADRRRRLRDAPGRGDQGRRAAARSAARLRRGDRRAPRAAGVLDVPAVRVGDRVFHGDRELEAAAAVLA